MSTTDIPAVITAWLQAAGTALLPIVLAAVYGAIRNWSAHITDQRLKGLVEAMVSWAEKTYPASEGSVKRSAVIAQVALLQPNASPSKVDAFLEQAVVSQPKLAPAVLGTVCPDPPGIVPLPADTSAIGLDGSAPTDLAAAGPFVEAGFNPAALFGGLLGTPQARDIGRMLLEQIAGAHLEGQWEDLKASYAAQGYMFFEGETPIVGVKLDPKADYEINAKALGAFYEASFQAVRWVLTHSGPLPK